MSIINTTVSAVTDGTYGMPNSIVGQIKTILLNDANVAIVSDNEPDNTTKRVLVYSVASQAHYTRIESTTGTAVTLSTLKLDATTAIISGAALTITSGYSYPARFLYNTKAHVFIVNESSVSTTFYINTGDSTHGWYIKAYGSGGTNVTYYNDSDTSGDMRRLTYFNLDSTGNFVGVPIRFTVNANLTDYYYPYLYGTVSEVLASNAGFYTSGGYNYLVISGYFLISDQVPL